MENNHNRDLYEDEMKRLYNRSQGIKEDFKGIVCPAYHKQPCRLCSLCKEILFDKSTKDTPIRAKASSLNESLKFYSNIIFMTNPSEIVVFEYGKSIFDQLIAGQMDALSEWKNFMHPQFGKNLFITKIAGSTSSRPTYHVEARAQMSPIPDPQVLHHLINDPRYNLTNVVANMEAGKIKTFYQSKLATQRTEVRFLPSWLGPQTSKFFEKVGYHYNIPQEDFEAVQRGEYDPLRELRQTNWKIPGSPTPPYEIKSTPDGWGTVVSPPLVTAPPPPVDPFAAWNTPKDAPARAPVAPESTIGTSPTEEPPVCFGEYEDNDPDCTVICKDDGWLDSCKAAYAEKKAMQARREAAKRVMR
jgi:hypothetical protein